MRLDRRREQPQDVTGEAPEIADGAAAIDRGDGGGESHLGRGADCLGAVGEARDSRVTTVRRYMSRGAAPRDDARSQTWTTFVRNHASAVLACDFFVTVTATFRVLYVFVVLEVGTRRILHWNVTEHPTAEWTAQQLRMVVSGEQGHRWLIHDHDRIYSEGVDATVAAMGLSILKTPVRTPQTNAFCERLIGTIRRGLADSVQRAACRPNHARVGNPLQSGPTTREPRSGYSGSPLRADWRTVSSASSSWGPSRHADGDSGRAASRVPTGTSGVNAFTGAGRSICGGQGGRVTRRNALPVILRITRISRAQYVSLPRFLSGFSGLSGSVKRLNPLESIPANGPSPPFRTTRLAHGSLVAGRVRSSPPSERSESRGLDSTRRHRPSF